MSKDPMNKIAKWDAFSEGGGMDGDAWTKKSKAMKFGVVPLIIVMVLLFYWANTPLGEIPKGYIKVKEVIPPYTAIFLLRLVFV